MQRESCKRMMASSAAEAVLLTGVANMRYVSGFMGEGYVYLSDKQSLVVTDSRYTVAAKQQCPDFTVVEWKSKHYYDALLEALRHDGVKKLGVEEAHMTLSDYHKLQKELEKDGLDVKMEFLSESLAKLRYVKTMDEIRCIEAAEAITDRAFSRMLPVLKTGMTEKQVAAYLEFFMKEEGADAFSFETIAASGIHSAMPHALPTQKTLEEGDFLTMDFGCVYNGYCSDMTRTVIFGRADEKQREIYETVLAAQRAALQGIRPGMTGKEIDALARDVIEEKGYGQYFGHSLGHSVGLEIHESPNFSPRESTRIEPGMVITVEPGIYIEGFGGVRIEDLVVVTENGCRNLTHSEKQLMEIGESEEIDAGK